MTLGFLLLLAALILFICAAFGVSTRINLTAAGLACLTGAMLAGSVALG
jgi:hypothetical protein